MLERIRDISRFAHWLGVNPFWIWLLIVLIAYYMIVRWKYVWRPKWKSKKTKDKDGNEIITHYHLDV